MNERHVKKFREVSATRGCCQRFDKAKILVEPSSGSPSA